MRKRLAILLLLVLLLTALPPAFAVTGQTPSGLSFAEMEQEIDALMAEHAGTTTPGAAVVVVQDGEIIFSRGYGWADMENQIPVDPALTVFEYGSINKTLIWVCPNNHAEIEGGRWNTRTAWGYTLRTPIS